MNLCIMESGNIVYQLSNIREAYEIKYASTFVTVSILFLQLRNQNDESKFLVCLFVCLFKVNALDVSM